MNRLRRTAVDNDERNLAVGCHLLGFLGLVFPLGNLVGPLALWLLKRDAGRFVDDHGREAVNFQITTLLALLIAGALTLVLVGFVLLAALAVFWLVVVVRAGLAAARGEAYRYPLSLRLIG